MLRGFAEQASHLWKKENLNCNNGSVWKTSSLCGINVTMIEGRMKQS